MFNETNEAHVIEGMFSFKINLKKRKSRDFIIMPIAKITHSLHGFFGGLANWEIRFFFYIYEAPDITDSCKVQHYIDHAVKHFLLDLLIIRPGYNTFFT